MANITKVYTPANIFQAPAEIYINIAAPTSSLTPSAGSNIVSLDSSGQPSSATGFHAGLMEAPMMPTITEKLNEINADQFEMAIDAAFDSIEAEIEFVMKETNLNRLFTLWTDANLGSYNAITGQQALQIGGQTSSVNTPVTVLAVSERRDASGKFVYWMLYKAVLASAVPLTFNRTKESVYKLKFKAFADLTRVAGDELMQIVRTK